jgi:hypothetical protein
MRFLTLVFMSVALAFAQGGGTFSVDVRLVTLDVAVTDSTGKPVNTLTREDLLIYEDGVPQQIHNFSSVNVPYNVLLLFDCSGSTRPKQELMTAAMTRFMDGLRPQDVLAIAQFGSAVDLRLDWKPRDTGPVDVRFGSFASCNDTDLYGAMEWAARKTAGVAGRKGVVVYTDGVAQLPMRPMSVGGRSVYRPANSSDDPAFQKLLQGVRGSGATFHFVAVDTDVNPQSAVPVDSIYALQQARARMEQLAETSGGRVAFPKDAEGVLPLYERISRELATSYSVGYISSNTLKDGSFRNITVRTRDDSARVRQSRVGYTAPE